MTNNHTSDQQGADPAAPHPALRQLDRLVGRWQVSGDEMSGQVTFNWMEGGFFLMQHVDLVHDGRPISGVEYIGYDPASGTLRSHYFGNQAEPFEYAWEIEGDTLTIWFNERGSEGSYSGQFSPDGNTNAGAWEWPGGGYASSMTRITGDARRVGP